MAGLNIRPDGALDFLSLGALVHRLDPGVIPFRKASECKIHVSGGEFNVAANLSDAFNMNAGIVSAMVDYPVGELVAERVRAMGVKPFYKRFAHNGVNGPNIATVYSDRGHGVRAPVVFYNRANEAAALLRPGDVDWRAIFQDGVRCFHSGGIFAALSESTGQLIIEGMQAAHEAGAITSFDLNFRAKLWGVWGGEQRASEIIGRILEHVDVLIGVPSLGDAAESKPDPGAAFAAIERVLGEHPRVRAVATTLREVHSSDHHSWQAVAWVQGQQYQSPTCELSVLDRVGSGDGFAAGFIYGLLAGKTPQEAVNLGWAHGALLTTYPGDTTMATLPEIIALAEGGSARIQR